MARINFTTRRIADFTCPPEKSQAFLWDSDVPKLAVRVTRNGARSYVFQYKVSHANEKRRLTIGSTSAWSIVQAREEARRLQRILDKGDDPMDVRSQEADAQQKERANKASRQLPARDAWNAYLAAPHPHWGEAHRRDHVLASQEGGVQAKIGNRLTKSGPLTSLLCQPLFEITSKVVEDWLITECKHRPTAAGNSYRKLRAFIKWCSENKGYSELVHADCCTTRAVRSIVPANKAKPDDCLQRDQLKPWFEQIKNIKNNTISVYLQALLLTGARREELLSLRWTDLNFDWKTMKIRDKVDESGMRTIPLTPYVATLISSLPRSNTWVFSSEKSATGKIVGVTKPHNKAIELARIPHVSLHGLRRSFSTLSGWLDIPDAIIAQIQGHKPSAIAEKHYKRRPIDLLREKHELFEAWILSEAGIYR